MLLELFVIVVRRCMAEASVDVAVFVADDRRTSDGRAWRKAAFSCLC